MNPKEEIKRIADQIAKKYKPEKIILYGSFAGGKPHKDSDVDLFIIKKTPKKRTNRHLEIDRMLLDRAMPLDILVYTPQEVKKRLGLGDSFIQNILQQGRVLYAQR